MAYIRKWCIVFIATIAIQSAPVTVSVNPSVQYQTITGFGAANTIKPWKVRVGDYIQNVDLTEAGYYDQIIGEFGLTVLRHEVPHEFEPENDNTNADSIDWNNFDTTILREHAQRYLEAREVAREKGEQLLFIATIASPPAWMKFNKSFAKRYDQPDKDRAENRLDPKYHEEFAEFCEAYITGMKRFLDIEIAALSLVNEPTNSLGWASCVYDPEQVREVVTVVGERFEAKGITTPLMIPEEDLGNVETLGTYVNGVLDEPQARNAISIVGMHAYELAWLKPAVPPPDSGTWAEVYEWGGQYDMPLWITEAPHFQNSWFGSFGLGRFMIHALRNGRVSLWCFYGLMGDKILEKNLMVNDSGHSHYDISRHFYRHIRPGAVQVASNTSHDSVEVVVFTGQKGGGLTIELINLAHSDFEVSVPNMPESSTFEVYRSTENELYSPVGTITATEPFSIPARSLNTLISKEKVRVRIDYPARKMSNLPRNQKLNLYRIDGKLVGRISDRHNPKKQLSTGIYLQVNPSLLKQPVKVRAIIR